MKQKFKWLLDVADQKPLLFSVLLLLIAVGALSAVVQDRDRKIQECREGQEVVQAYYNNKVDSIVNYYTNREIELNGEVKKTLNSIIDNYRSQLDEQRKLNDRITSTINETKSIIKRKTQ